MRPHMENTGVQRVAVVIPTLNAGEAWRGWIDAFQAQTLRPQRVLVIDSSSNDATVALARDAGFDVEIIPKASFDHGGTRQLGVEMTAPCEVVAFLSQDATPAHPEALERLVAALDADDVGAAYGRQIPYPHASAMERYSRSFNYPAEGRVKRLSDAPSLKFRTVFMSNAFSAYRRDVLERVGGFRPNLISMEDEYMAARILLAGSAIAYAADAEVFHSHDYALWGEFSRYFDFGVFHAREPWIRETFGEAEGEGLRLLRKQLAYLWREQASMIPAAVARMAAKFAGFRLGKMEARLPITLKRRLSMNRRYWDK